MKTKMPSVGKTYSTFSLFSFSFFDLEKYKCRSSPEAT
jgi:hypothetical protein